MKNIKKIIMINLLILKQIVCVAEQKLLEVYIDEELCEDDDILDEIECINRIKRKNCSCSYYYPIK